MELLAAIVVGDWVCHGLTLDNLEREDEWITRADQASLLLPPSIRQQSRSQIYWKFIERSVA
jgi:hypothetical protein